MRLTLTRLDDLAASAQTFGLDKRLAPEIRGGFQPPHFDHVRVQVVDLDF
jgi:hypothetical protein